MVSHVRSFDCQFIQRPLHPSVPTSSIQISQLRRAQHSYPSFLNLQQPMQPHTKRPFLRQSTYKAKGCSKRAYVHRHANGSMLGCRSSRSYSFERSRCSLCFSWSSCWLVAQSSIMSSVSTSALGRAMASSSTIFCLLKETDQELWNSVPVLPSKIPVPHPNRQVSSRPK